MSKQVDDGFWGQQSERVSNNAVVVRGETELTLGNPGISGADLTEATCIRWGHLLWHARFGDAPRYAISACAEAAGVLGERAQAMAEESVPSIPVDLLSGVLIPRKRGGSTCEYTALTVKRGDLRAKLQFEQGRLTSIESIGDCKHPGQID